MGKRILKNVSALSIIRQILEAASTEDASGFDGATEAQIMDKASLSYDLLEQYLQILTENDVLRYDEQRQTYKTTEKGQRFLQIYNEAGTVMKEQV